MWETFALPRPDRIAESAAYREALAKIFAYSARPRTAEALRADRALKRGRMQVLLERLGNPQHGYRTVLIGGTKGKGSTAASLASILRAAGFRVGRYTQPHLVSWCERTWCDGEFISQEDVTRILPSVAAAALDLERLSPELGLVTTFEIGTALSLVYFAESAVDTAVVEVGIGGRTDATNALEPHVSVITSVSLDHIDTIGPTLADIAREKAGIMREGRPVIVAPQRPDVFDILRTQAEVQGSSLLDVLNTWRWEPEFGLASDAQLPSGRAPFRAIGPMVTIPECETPLIGKVQRDNALTAIAAADALVPLTGDGFAAAVRIGLASVHWPGRTQILREAPLALVDGAHNAESAEQLVSTLRACFDFQRLSWVIGMTRGKDIDGFLEAVLPTAHRVFVAASRHERALDAKDLAERCQVMLQEIGQSDTSVQTVSSASLGLDLALRDAGENDAVCVTGSLFLVGELLEGSLPGDLRG